MNYTNEQARAFQNYAKNDESVREVPLFKQIIPFAKYYLSTLKTTSLFTNLRGNKEFLTKQGYDHLIASIEKKIRSKAIELNLTFDDEGFTPYIFRHTYATVMFYAGIPLKEAEYYMGHADSKMLNDVYIHLDKKKMRENEGIDNYLATRVKETVSLIENQLN